MYLQMMKTQLVNILRIVFPAVLIITIGLACAQPSCPQLNTKAPDFTLQDLNGEQVSLKDYLGKNIILNFWATWCGYCKYQFPFMQEIYEKYSASGLAVLAINDRESSEKAAAYIRANGFTFTVLLDKNSAVNQLYCVPALPSTMFIDANGIIKLGKAGAFSSTQELESALVYFQ